MLVKIEFEGTHKELIDLCGAMPCKAEEVSIKASLAFCKSTELIEAGGLTRTELLTRVAAVGSGNRINQIKQLRELTGWGLKDAKDWVEAAVARGQLL
jgi:ribosomal protein L7/L12